MKNEENMTLHKSIFIIKCILNCLESIEKAGI